MENILQAVERARAGRPDPAIQAPALQPAAQPRANLASNLENREARTFALDDTLLRSRRIIAQDSTDPGSRAFDILRTQVLRSMDMRKMQFLAVTSPTAGCGKTVTSINLALSIARYPEHPVLLIDMDLKKPQLATTFGISPAPGLLTVFEQRVSLRDAISETRVGENTMMVLPTEKVASGSAELLASRAVGDLFQEIKRLHPALITVIDLPPVLSGDDVLAILPQVDGVLLVTAVGTTKPAEIEECSKQLQSADIVRVVLNKSQELSAINYY